MIPPWVIRTPALSQARPLIRSRLTGDARSAEPAKLISKNPSSGGRHRILPGFADDGSNNLKEIAMALYEIPGGDRIQEGGMGGFTVNGRKIVLSKYKGKYYAINGSCPHQGGDLAAGILEGKNLICPRHGHKIDITTGRHASLFKASFLKSNNSEERFYRVVTEGHTLKIEM
jgi:nitrite reductase/ring-hydroxylating ferredoxin subunit